MKCLDLLLALDLSRAGLNNRPIEILLSYSDKSKQLRCNQPVYNLQNTLRTPPPSVDISPLECRALQREEIETLQAIYDRDVTTLNDDGTCFVVQIKFLSDEIKDEDIIKVWFRLV